MRQGELQKDDSLKSSSVEVLKRRKGHRCNVSTFQRFNGFALYEVLIGIAIFALGVLALGRAAHNCVNANALNSDEERVRQILSNRMAEIQATPGFPDPSKEFKINSGYGVVRLIQKSTAATLTEADGGKLTGINLVVLTAQWLRGGVTQSKHIEFYVYRNG